MHKGKDLKRVRLELAKKWPEFVVPIGTRATCDACERNDSCQFAFDAYNTDGDCLDSK